MPSLCHRTGLSGLALAATVLVGPVSAGGLELHVTGSDGDALRYAVAYVESEQLAIEVDEQARPVGEVDQRDGHFEPHSQAIERGTEVGFPNSDEVRHHVFSFSDARSFELPLYAGEPPRLVDFDAAGVVVLGCNIHDHMIAYLLVVDTAVFGNADEAGRIRLNGVPDDPDATLRVWHPGLGDAQAGTAVAMEPDAHGVVHVSLDVTDEPPPAPRGLGERRRDLQDRFD